jgi:hypothetical protein
MRIVAPVGWCLIKGPDNRTRRNEEDDEDSEPQIQSGWRKQEIRLGRRHHDLACEEIMCVVKKAGVRLPSAEAKLIVAEMLERYSDRASVEVHRVYKDLAKKYGVARSLSLAPSTASLAPTKVAKKRGKQATASSSDARALTTAELLETLTPSELGPIAGLERAHQEKLQQAGPSAALVKLVAARNSGQATFCSLTPFASTAEYCSTLPALDPITSDDDTGSSDDSSAAPVRRKRQAPRRKPAAGRSRRAAAVDSDSDGSDAEPPVKRKPGRPSKLKAAADGLQSGEKQPRRTAAAAAAAAAAAQATPAVSNCSETPAVKRKPGRRKAVRSDGTHRHDRFERRPERPRRGCTADL